MTRTTDKQKKTADCINSGWLSGARICASPNYNERPDGEVSLLVIHNISLPPGQFGTGCVEQFFCNQLDVSAHSYFKQIENLRVSAHLLIQRDGELIQFVPLDKRAWHAGESNFAGRENCNDFSIGIELEGTDDTPFTEAQYDRLLEIIPLLQREYPLIKNDRITGHQHIAPGRKTDPGYLFDWEYLQQQLAKVSI